MAIRARKRPQPLATSTPRRWLPLICHTSAFTTKPPSRGRPGSRLNNPKIRLSPANSRTIAPSKGETWLALWMLASRPTPRAKLTAGPAMATARAPQGELHSRSTLATPPIKNRVMLLTFTPWARATSEWPSSCSSTDKNNSRAVIRPRPQGHPTGSDAAAEGLALSANCWAKALVASTRITNQLGCTRIGIPRILTICQP